VLPNRPVGALQKRGRDLLERGQFFDAEDHPSSL
jgi:hypothetical protein